MELNYDQIRIVETKPNGHMLVKGVAGSGKTTVIVHKIPHLLNHYCFDEDDRILVVTYAKTLISYINYIYGKMDKTTTLFTFMSNNGDKRDVKTIDSIIMSLFNQYKQIINIDYMLIENKDKYRLINYAIHLVSKKYPNINIINPQNKRFLLDEIDWIKSNNYMNIETYQNIDRRGRASNLEGEGPQRLLKRSESRGAVFDLMIEYGKLMKKERLTDFKTIALNVLYGIEKSLIECDKYTHLLIDESQDLTRVQLEILSKMYNNTKPYSSIIFVADTAQSIYMHSWLSYHSFKSIGFDMSGKSRVLEKNYRTTTQIAEAAYSLIEGDENITSNDNYVKPSIIEREGVYPLYKSFKSVEEELQFICKQIKEKLYKKYELNQIAIIARSRRKLTNAREYLIKNGIDAEIVNKSNPDFDKVSVKLITMHSIKGLEFDVVVVIGLNDDIIPIKDHNNTVDKNLESVERKLLYVGMTRAKEELYLTSSGKPSKFINEINPKYLRFKDENCFTKLRHISVESYKFTEKITELYGYEEVTRQWVINELHEKLNYPYEMIDIEHAVKLFSKTGYVDVVVYKHHNGKKTPYIYIEVKKPHEYLDNALNQLKSYMNATRDVKYGLATDGVEVTIVKKQGHDFITIDSLPFFDDNIGNLTEEFAYIDFRWGKNYKILRNVEDQETICLYDDKSDTICKVDNYHKLKVYGDIAAGNLKLAVEEITEEFTLPDTLLYDIENCFMLKITGDSMINAGIEKDDYVVVHKQNYAENLDIVAAVVDNEATLKKFSRMGNKILLMPENKDYEPIIVDEQDLIINGKVIGVLKK